MARNRFINQCGLVGLVFFSTPWVNAKTLTLSAGLDAISTDNANQVGAPNVPIDEWQTSQILRLEGERQGSYSLFESDGRLESRQFSEQKEQNQTLYLGAMNLFVGTDYSRFAGDLGYSSAEVLVNPLLGDSAENLVLRSIASSTGYLRLGSPVDRLMFRVNAAKVGYDKLKVNNSTQHGGGLLYQRALSAVSYIGFDVSGYQLKYDNEDKHLNYRRMAVNIGAELRALTYTASMGVNDAGGGTSRHPFYDLSVEYGHAENKVSFLASQLLTDTSQGSGNDSSFSGANISDGNVGIFDRYTRRVAALRWDYGGVCQLCELTARLGRQQEQYETLNEQNTREQFATISFGYQPNPSLRLIVDTQYRGLDYERQLTAFDEKTYRFSVASDRIIKGAELRIYVEKAERDFTSDLSADYDVNSVGLQFNYQLYSR